MLNQKRWYILLMLVFLGLAAEVVMPGKCITAVAAETEPAEEETKGSLNLLSVEDIWKEVYRELMYGTEMTEKKLAALVMAEVKSRDVELMTNETDHIVSYHGRRFAITEDEYQVLLKIVEAEAPHEDVTGKMLVANVVMNRLERHEGGTISDVVFARGQFEPVINGSIFRVTPSEATIEAVERVLAGEDESQGALYFMARDLASWNGTRWFDQNLKFLFKHGGHEFYTEKE